MAYAQALEQVRAEHPHKRDIVHPLHKLRFLFAGNGRGGILDRGIGKGHPSRIVRRHIRIDGKVLPEAGGVSIRRSVALMKFFRKRQKLPLELCQGEPQVRHNRQYPQQSERLLVFRRNRPGKISRFRKIRCVLQIVLRKNGIHITVDNFIFQAGERRHISQKFHDLKGALPRRSHLRCVCLPKLERPHIQVERHTELGQLRYDLIGNVQRGAGQRPGRHGLPLIGHVVLPEIQRQERVFNQIQTPLPLSCFLFLIIPQTSPIGKMACHVF